MYDWKPVVGFEGIYVVRPGKDGGKVKRIVPIKRSRVGKELGKPDKSGYIRAVLSRPGEPPKYVRLHALILAAFVGPKPDGMEACHRDDCKHNNTLENLYWGI